MHGTPDCLRKLLAYDCWDFAQIQLNYYDWYQGTAKQQYEMPAAEWRRLRPFYTLTVEALKNERDRAARRGGVKQVRENGEGA